MPRVKEHASSVPILPELPVQAGVSLTIPTRQKSLPVPLLAQQTSMWCWAASAEMVMKYAGHDVAQCKQANHEFGRTDCCNSPVPDACVQGGWPEFPIWKFSTQITSWGVALTFDQIMAQIDANRPFCFSWGWSGGGGHMMVVRGYYWSSFAFFNVGPFVYINDPWEPNVGDTRWITYADFVAKAGNHVHWVDYFNIKYTGVRSSREFEEDTMDPSSRATNPPGYGDPETAAREALQFLPVLATPDIAKEMGFDSVPKAATALDLRQGLPIHYIRHDALAAHLTGQDARKLLVDGEEMLYPVYKDGKPVCSIVVAKERGVWTMRSIGDSNLVKQLTEVRDRQASVSGREHSKYFIVSIPSMYKMFVAHYDSSGKLMLSHIHDDPAYGFAKHATHDAEHVVNTMLPHAKALKSALPPKR